MSKEPGEVSQGQTLTGYFSIPARGRSYILGKQPGGGKASRKKLPAGLQGSD